MAWFVDAQGSLNGTGSSWGSFGFCVFFLIIVIIIIFFV
jgi:hypothetical protein